MVKCRYFILILNFVFTSSHAQTAAKKDSIFYFVDTLKTPVKDRIVTTRVDDRDKTYIIRCRCLSDGSNAEFLSFETRRKAITKSAFRSYKLISLSSLIAFIKVNDTGKQRDNDAFLKAHDIFFIEPSGKNYVLNKVFFTGSGVTVIDDTVHIPPVSSKKD